MHKNLVTVLRLSALSAALLAAGCGGGGGGGSGAANGAGPQRTVEGTAAKGIIKGARVQVFSLDAQGARSTASIANSKTAPDGTFSVRIPAGVLRFMVEVDAAEGATMADEATGKDIPVPASLKLRNVVTLAESAETIYRGTISPLTEMVVQTAEKAPGGLLAANIAQAKAGVTATLGFDPEKVRPIDSNSSAASGATEEEKLQSLTLAAISFMASEKQIGCAEEDPSERIACVVDKIADLGTISGNSLELGPLRTQMRQAMADVALKPTINRTGKNSIEGMPSFAQEKVPTTVGTLTGVEAAKKLFASLRTNLSAVSNETRTGEWDVPVAAVKADFSKAIAPLDLSLENWIGTTANAIDYFGKYKAGTVTSATMSLSPSSQGSCTIYSDANTVATSPAAAANIACSFVRQVVPASYSSSPNGYTMKEVVDTVVITPAANGGAAYTYSADARLHVSTYTYSNAVGLGNSVSRDAGTAIGSYGSADRATGSIAYTKVSTTLDSLSINGKMPARTDANGLAATDHEVWNLNMARADEGSNVFKYGFSGDLTSVKSGAVVGKLSLNTGSFARIQFDANGGIPQNGVKELNLIVSGDAGSSKITGTLNLAEGMADKNGFDYAPTKVTFTGSLSKDGGEFFTGTLTVQSVGYDTFDSTQPDSASNFVKQSVSLAGKLTTPARPALTLTISASNDAFDSESLTAQYIDGSSVVNISVTGGAGGKPTLTTISSADGVAFEFLDAHGTVAVMKDNAKVGLINLDTGMLNYVDGSFESLN